ncbi:MAG: hypothetical protein VW625_02790, partial [Perlucidibaca sp.]
SPDKPPRTDVLCWLLSCLPLAGCASGAPTHVLFGAYFPFWLTSALAGVVAGIIAHRVFVARELVGRVPYQLSVCTAVGSLVAVVCWLLGTGLIG